MKANAPLLVASLSVLGVGFASVQNRTQRVSYAKDVRPILSESCFKCHGPDATKISAGLQLDTFEHATKKAVIPGKPAQSLLIQRVTEKDPDLRMPPPGGGHALSAKQIQTLKDWIEQGANYEQHWAFVPPKMPTSPVVANRAWSRTGLDRFVLHRLEREKLTPEPEADLFTLAERASHVLTGLPLTPAELTALKADKSPGAYERLVDRLFAKAAYGEHMARYWMDAVRYGDTHGLQLDNERAVFPYRDWVVRAFNQDLPYRDFVRWQLAGDLLKNPTTEQLIATGYVRMNLTSNEGGAIAEEFLARNTFDRVDTTSTVLLGLTVGCAKCHDHKYDPISQRDYYSLYAYFNNTTDEPSDGNIALPPPFIKAPDPVQAKEINQLEAQRAKLVDSIELSEAVRWLETNSPKVPVGKDWQISPIYTSSNFDQAFDEQKPGEPGQTGAAAWKPFPVTFGKDINNFIRKDNSFAYIRGTLVFDEAGPVTFNVGSDDAIKVWVNGKLVHSNKIGRGLAQANDTVRAEFRQGANEFVAKVVNGVSFDGFRISFGKELEQRISTGLKQYRAEPKNSAIQRELKQLLLEAGPSSNAASNFRTLTEKLTKLQAEIPASLIAQERKSPRPTFILKRGQYDQKGESVSRHIPKILGSLKPGQPNDRLGLADWMTDPSNPLVSRVFVNRLWQQVFGVGIVKTVEDFGMQGEWPNNPELLDYLAVKFREGGWSVKKLLREIVTSSTFRQSSRVSKEKLARDPENRLNSRGPRYRLDAEVIRDKALYAGGILLEKLGGKGFKPYQPDGLWEGTSDPASSTHFYVRDKSAEIYRRSLYLYWKRTSPPPVMTTFDAPLRDSCVVRRSVTNTPLQALALLNETAFLEASRAMALRVYKASATDAGRLKHLFELAFGRAPRTEEESILTRSLRRYRDQYAKDAKATEALLSVGDLPKSMVAPKSEQVAWMLVCSSVMNTDEFLTLH
jgi:hypothetical protein